MPAPIVPWEPSNFPIEIQNELNRRKVNRSFKYFAAEKGGWNGTDGDWNRYRGPMIPWVRFCSNGVGIERPGIPNKEGFVFFGGKNFYDGYGFTKNTMGTPESIIGYLPDGITTHTIDNDLKTSDYPIHTPTPEIEKISISIQKELYRKVTIDWVCFSKQQLEYMTPYFLVPGISCIIEWGWNNFNPQSLLPLDDIAELKQLFEHPYTLYENNILKSNGNYDLLVGIITSFEWSVDGNKFKCKTELTSKDRLYAGLAVDASAADKNEEGTESPFGNLLQFIENNTDSFKRVFKENPESIEQLAGLTTYIKKHHPTNANEYLYGVFYGRDPEDASSAPDADKFKDFDRKSKNKELWLNLGLVIEILNFHVKEMEYIKDAEHFRVDIDNVVITGHSNLISGDGRVLLIPNKMAPKYFQGEVGPEKAGEQNESAADYALLENSTYVSLPVSMADKRLSTICRQTELVYRDDIDELINHIRYMKVGGRSFAFPFMSDQPSTGKEPYPAKYSGYLKDLYINISLLKSMVSSDGGVKTYHQLIVKMLGEISKAAGNFWDFRILSGTGRKDDKNPATMKIIDDKFEATANSGIPFSFDYFDADSLLLGISFKPTISNAQAIRTIYAPTSAMSGKKVMINGDNELLEYKFRDRLRKDDNAKISETTKKNEQFTQILRQLQQLNTNPDTYQMTCQSSGGILVRRLVMPNASSVLQMLLDDGDLENNPKYTGIMPGIQATFTLQGIGGLRTFMMFLVRNLPKPYSEKNIVFRITDVQGSIESGKWITTITAGVMPLRNSLKKRLGIPIQALIAK